MTRETRLLLATIGVSAVVVLLLSTLRFPDSPRITEAPPAPLERLAASAAYEQLARSVERVSRRVSPDLFIVRSGTANGHASRSLSDVLSHPLAVDIGRHFPALRVADTRAVLATDLQSGGASLDDQSGRALRVVAVDTLRRVTLLDVPRASSAQVAPVTLSELQTPTYVVIAEGTAAGVAFRPVFVGSADRFSDPRWTRQLLAVSGTPLTSAGALVFSLEGQFIGAAVVQPNGTFAIAGAAEIISTASELGAGAGTPTLDTGIRVQSLTPALATALNAPQGVVVASVEPNGLAAGSLQPTDVITSIDGTPVSLPDDVLVRLAKMRSPAINMNVVRGGVPLAVTLTRDGPARAPGQPLGDTASFERIAGSGSVVTSVAASSPLALAGLRVRDLVVRVGALSAPTPAQLAASLRQIQDGGTLVLVVRRDGVDHVLAVTVPSRLS